MNLRFGVIALARPTFDVPFAEENFKNALDALQRANIEIVGASKLLFDADMANQELNEIEKHGSIDALLIIQITFTDASMTVEIARNSSVPVAIWAIPEPRLGGRLRLNAFCGLNLAAHSLGKAGLSHNALYALPDSNDIIEKLQSLSKKPVEHRTNAALPQYAHHDDADRVISVLEGSQISVFGKHPVGFDTCDYDELELTELTGIKIQPYALNTLFDKAKSADKDRVAMVRSSVNKSLSDLDKVNQVELDRSLRLFCALEDLQKESNAKGLAVRCWPETFTEYGCAACGPMAMMNQKGIPSACEADVYGSLSTIILQELAQEPAWMADLVDLDFDNNTGVFWHCGLAPLSMCDPEYKPEATIHTNRQMPLLHQFPLKPGVFTIARLSQSKKQTKMVIGHSEFIRAPMAFTGTSGVMKFNSSAHDIFNTIITEGLEHHYAIAYGDHRPALRAICAKLNLPLLELN